MIETSRDVLNYALALSVLILTFLTAWILWYIIGIFREIKRLTVDIAKAVEKFSRVLDDAREKLSHLAGMIPLVMKAAETVVASIQRIREKRSANQAADGSKNKKRKI